jgi:hypothetical protein
MSPFYTPRTDRLERKQGRLSVVNQLHRNLLKAYLSITALRATSIDFSTSFTSDAVEGHVRQPGLEVARQFPCFE